jgi:hypothetical protein
MPPKERTLVFWGAGGLASLTSSEQVGHVAGLLLKPEEAVSRTMVRNQQEPTKGPLFGRTDQWQKKSVGNGLLDT